MAQTLYCDVIFPGLKSYKDSKKWSRTRNERSVATRITNQHSIHSNELHYGRKSCSAQAPLTHLQLQCIAWQWAPKHFDIFHLDWKQNSFHNLSLAQDSQVLQLNLFWPCTPRWVMKLETMKAENRNLSAHI